MAFTVPLSEAQKLFPDYKFVSALPPSAQKAAFHVLDADENNLCLKIIAPDYSIDRIEREIVALQSLSHPNVAKLIEYTFSTKEGKPRHYILEEFIDGEDLSSRLKVGDPWSVEEVVRIFQWIAEGLAAIHRAHIVHRDLKPSNLRIRKSGVPVIIDFGLARHLDLPDITKTEEGAAIGTPAYFAPEQFLGTKHDIDHRTDLFALGIMLYEAAVGQHPFYQDGMSYADLKERACNSDEHFSAQAFKELPGTLKMLIIRLLQKERAKRPATTADVAKGLELAGGAIEDGE